MSHGKLLIFLSKYLAFCSIDYKKKQIIQVEIKPKPVIETNT